MTGLSAPSTRVVVPLSTWHSACSAAHRDGALYFDFLAASELADGSGVEWVLHVASAGPPLHHRFIVTTVRYDEAVSSIADVYAGAAWHEREAHEMFGLAFTGHPDLRPLLLEDDSVRPMRKSYTLTQRVDTPWPGAEGRKRPLGVPRGEGRP